MIRSFPEEPRATRRARSMHARGQSSLEFVVLTAAAILAVTLILSVAYSILRDVRAAQNDAQIRAVHLALERELSLAERSPTGYYRRFELPKTIGGVPYVMTTLIESEPQLDAIRIDWRDANRTVFVTQNITGTFAGGTNTLRRSDGRISVNS